MANITDGFNRNTWTFDKVDVDIYLENVSGCVINATGGSVVDFDPRSVIPQASPYFRYCYLESGSIEGSKQNTRRKVTGRSHLKLTPGDWQWIFSVSELYFNRTAQADFPTVFDRKQKLRIVLKLSDLSQHEKNAYHELKHVYADEWKLNGTQADVVVINATFEAEEHKVW